jgi:hypothetical protein
MQKAGRDDGSVPPSSAPAAKPSLRTAIAAFAAVYIIWGSTYLGILYAIRTIPIFVMGGARFVIAGVVLIAVGFARGAKRPNARELWTTIVSGVMLLALGNASVIWAETRIPSGTAALLVTTPLWMVTIEWARGRRPTPHVIVGLILGMIGGERLPVHSLRARPRLARAYVRTPDGIRRNRTLARGRGYR